MNMENRISKDVYHNFIQPNQTRPEMVVAAKYKDKTLYFKVDTGIDPSVFRKMVERWAAREEANELMELNIREEENRIEKMLTEENK